MFDTVDFFQAVCDYYNTNYICDKYWQLDIGRTDHTNIKKWTEENVCNVAMFLEWFKETEVNSIDSDDISELDYIRSDFEMFIGVNSDLTRQLYKEVERDKVDESKYAVYLKPIKTCAKNIFSQDLCSGITYQNVSREFKINYKDQNLDGWVFKGSLRFYAGTDAYETSPIDGDSLTYNLNF